MRAPALAVLLLAAAAPVPTPQPRLVIPQPVFDFGEVSPGEAVEHEFEIGNDGDAVLLVSDVIGGCACTTADFDREIAPGASGRIHAVFDTTSMVGSIAKQIALYSNDPDAPKSLLTMRVTVKPLVTLRPESLRLEGVRHDPPVTAGTTLWATDGADLQILKVESSEPALKVSFRQAAGAELAADGRGRQWRVEATLDPAAPVGPVAALIHVFTNHPTAGALSLSVFGAQRQPLVVTPSSAALGDVRPGPGYRHTLRLQNLGAMPVEVEDIASTVPALRAEATKRADGRSYDITLLLDAAMAKGDFAGMLVIRTTSPEQPRLEVAVSGKAL